MSSSFPYLAIAKKYGMDYGDTLKLAHRIMRGEKLVVSEEGKAMLLFPQLRNYTGLLIPQAAIEDIGKASARFINMAAERVEYP